MESLRWSNKFMNELITVTHYSMEGDELVDLDPHKRVTRRASVRSPATENSEQQGTWLAAMVDSLGWTFAIYCLCHLHVCDDTACHGLLQTLTITLSLLIKCYLSTQLHTGPQAIVLLFFFMVILVWVWMDCTCTCIHTSSQLLSPSKAQFPTFPCSFCLNFQLLTHFFLRH